MGRRGPPRTPTAVLEARDSWRAKVRKGTEPKAVPGTPTPPSWLDAKSAHHWREIAPLLNSMGVLHLVERDILTLYCRTWSRWREAEETLRSKGQWYEVESREGGIVLREHPAVKIARETSALLARLLPQLGMTPSGRASLDVRPDDEEPGDESPFSGAPAATGS